MRKQARSSQKAHILTRAITHIKLAEANRGKLAELDKVWEVYQGLCQQYVRYFCTEATPDPNADFVFESVLSARWQRVAVQQAAGIAQSWRTRRAEAYADFAARHAHYQSLPQAEQARRGQPVWTEWKTPILKAVCIQANANVVLRVGEDYGALGLSQAEKGAFDFWLRISTLEKGQPIFIPVRLSAYHRDAMRGLRPNSSVSLNQRKGSWWLTLTVSEPLPQVEDTAQRGRAGGDVGIRNYFTDSAGHRFGGVDERFASRVQRVREKARRKAKLRACLEKKGAPRLPSTASAASQRLSRHVRQDINRAVNLALSAHQRDIIAVEALSVASMRFKAKRMNAYLRASNLAHVLKQLQWGAAKRGIPLVEVPAAYSSQECPRCHFTHRANRPNQQTFCCQVCGFAQHADVVGALNLESRLDDHELFACQGKEAIKALLDARHALWRAQNGYP